MVQLYRAVVRKDEVFVEFGPAKPLQDPYHLRLPVGAPGPVRQTGHNHGGPAAREGLELRRRKEERHRGASTRVCGGCVFFKTHMCFKKKLKI